MDVKTAVDLAKTYILDVFADEHITNLGLDETEYDQASKTWIITFGFSRPWNTPRTRAQEILEILGAASALRRTYRSVTISEDGNVISMKRRSTEPAE